ncbi:MAG: sodium:solute symporter [Prolixibacteraceae bacterium]|jgi:solute:Na+ symporter, SSS family|nr:sodium:solute symporter [Prolixibacteraceae bacterium]MBT6997674.1 sodium:solute symporter [Prolixibacteraceae bacterium]MBT7396108.1 sodium:solute symporter [Prolixibacteraceae bacterium]
MKLPVLDLAVFILITFGNVLFGASFYFRNKTSDQFTSGGGKLPAWVVGMSIFATFVSSISFLALPGKAYMSNWNALVFSFSIPIASILAVKFFVPLYRSLGSISAYNYLEIRFGTWARIYASICYMLTQLMRTGAILLLLALPLNALFGWNIKTIIIVTGIAVTAYSMLGGIQAVIWTDAIQAIILIVGALVSAIVLTFSMPEGPKQLFEIAAANDKFSLGSFGASLSESTFWVILIYSLFINLQNFGIDQNFVQRYMTTSSVKKAKSSTLFGALLYLPVSLVFFYIGTALFSYYTAQPDLLPAELKVPGAGDKVFPHFIVNALPTGITGLLIAAIFAAGMSTVSTSINSTATIVLSDYYKRYFNKNPNEKSSMKVLYISSVIFGALGVIISLALVGVESVLDTWWSLASIFSGGMLGLFLLAFLSKKVRNIDAVIGVIIGVLVIIWMSLTPLYFTEGNLLAFKSPFHSNLTIVIGTLVIFLVGFISIKLFSVKKVEK